MSAESPRHARGAGGGPLTVPPQPPSDRSIIDAVSGFINDVTLSSSSAQDPKDVIQWARFETADINEPTPEGASDNDVSPLLLVLGYGSGVQVWLVAASGEAQEVLSWRQGTVRVLRILPTPTHGDCFAPKRPLIALCDSAGPPPAFCALSFISIRGGEQVKSIKFKNPILDVLANKRSVVVSFSERFAVFDAATLEDRMAITTCYPCPCPLGGSAPINPLALGDRWLAYADKKLNQSKRSSGGCEGEGQPSYTATVLHAAKSLSKGLRGLGESVAHSLAGGARSASQSPSPPHADAPQPGRVTVIDVQGNDEEDGLDSEEPYEPVVAHFVAHSEAIIALKFDASGTLLVTADRRGHDFHVFRINPHPCGSSLASVHHLYILHRGDTTAKVQDIAISPDSRWAAVSTLRGTTHVFALSPYGGACGVRTHTAPRVVNRLSRFHRSAGLPIHAGAMHSPVSEGSGGTWFPNPRLPPFPVPCVGAPLAQLRPTATLPTHTITRTSSGRQRLSSLSEDSGAAPLLARAWFGPPPPAPARPAVAALYLMSATGCLSHLALHPRPARNIPKEKICDESPIELDVVPIAQWPLQRGQTASDLLAPLPPSNPLLQPTSCRRCADMCMSEEERWLSQVEIVTHAGPHRRLWMGPQFVFKTYNCTGSNSSLSEAETVEVDTVGVARSNPVNVPAPRPVLPVLVDSGSASSLEHSPSDSFRRKSLLEGARGGDTQLREDLAEAMKEDHGWREDTHPRSGGRESRGSPGSRGPSPRRAGPVARAVGPLGTVVAPPPAPAPPPLHSDEHTQLNEDEATFRPVVRAPATLSLQPDMVIRPLPRTTTIPVQTVPPLAGLSPSEEPLPLTTDVVIPAALTTHDDWHSALDDAEDQPSSESVPVSLDEPPMIEKIEKPPVEPAPKVEDRGRKNDTATRIDKSLKQKEAAAEPTKSFEAKSDKAAQKESKVDVKTVEKEPPAKTERAASQKTAAAKPDKTETKSAPAKSDRSTKQKVEETRNETAETAPNVASTVCSVNVDVKRTDVNKDLKRQESDARRHERARDRGSAERAERDECTPLPKSNRPADDIQPPTSVRLKKSPTPKSVSDRDSEVSSKDKSNDEPEEVVQPKELKKTKEVKEPKEIKKQKDFNSRGIKELQDTKEAFVRDKSSEEFKNVDVLESDKVDKRDQIVVVEDEPSVAVTLKMPTKKEISETKSKKQEDIDIKTEEQAWDMLLNEPDKPISFNISLQCTEEKSKSKKNKKIKKTQDDSQEKTDDDSFVEIHAIEENQQLSSELVSISMPFEDTESTTSYVKPKKQRSPKLTPERKDECHRKSIESLPQETELISLKSRSSKKYDDKSDIEVLPRLVQVQKEIFKETSSSKVRKHYDSTASENSSYFAKEAARPIKSKSLSPYPELRKSEKLAELDKDVYVINTGEEDFPEIQITRGAKPRKRSPQPIERKSNEKEKTIEKPVKSWSAITEKKAPEKEPVIEKPVKSWSSIAERKTPEKEMAIEKPVKSWSSIAERKVSEKEPVIEKPVKSWSSIAERKAPEKETVAEKPSKSWSSIAASKSSKKVDEVEGLFQPIEKKSEKENPMSSTTVSLQDKLIELCKRTDIMVAECDAPSELNFIEEHVLHDLPPLEPLDFGLDDFKLEVMKDSLLEVKEAKTTSPICKINIDDILSSIKETTNRAIESSVFNLIDLEKVPARKEKGFSVIEEHKITSQEVKLEDDVKEEKEGEMEKSSEDDTSPVVSTDSDKEEKKSSGASSQVLPLSKQSTKSKKSRRKKK